jgi:hypothetical protein
LRFISLIIILSNSSAVELPASFTVWAASPGARFAKGRILWCNWDVTELKTMTAKIEESDLLTTGMVGFPTWDLVKG